VAAAQNNGLRKKPKPMTARAAQTGGRRRATAAESAEGQRPQIRIMFRKAIAMGPGKADLLKAIERTGSISAAARELGMSYRRAWLLVDTMNQCFMTPLVETLTGGQHGGGARVTELGQDVLKRYLAMEAKATASVQRELSEFAGLMASIPKR
jgi:molybdate transport system regulatory protein